MGSVEGIDAIGSQTCLNLMIYKIDCGYIISSPKNILFGIYCWQTDASQYWNASRFTFIFTVTNVKNTKRKSSSNLVPICMWKLHGKFANIIQLWYDIIPLTQIYLKIVTIKVKQNKNLLILLLG